MSLINGSIVAKKYQIIRKNGSGTYGDIFLAVNITNGEEVAIKIESSMIYHSRLFFEYKLYRILQGSNGIAKIRCFLQEHGFNILIMDFLGPSIHDLHEYCSYQFSLKTVLILADQMIKRLELLHANNFIHRDIKPDNFLMGSDHYCNTVFLIDFGLAKQYRHHRTGTHIPYREDIEHLTGTAQFSSINSHCGVEQSRRDDLESLGYVFIYFIKGSLPWLGIKASNKNQKYEKIAEKKMSTSVKKLCKGIPAEFGIYLNYCRNLKFEEAPDYNYLRQIFKDLFKSNNYDNDYIYDWTTFKLQTPRNK